MAVIREKAYGPFRRRPSHRLRSKLTILRRAGAVGLGCLLGLGTIVEANAYNHGHSADAPSLAAAEATSDGMTGMSVEGMGAMMRPDMSPPLGVTGGMSPKQGVFMPSVQYMHMRMDGNRDGTDDVSTAEVLAEFPIAPLNMDVDMLMAGAMYGITDDISVMAMISYVWKSMDHVNRMGTEFTTKSEGFGDLRVIGGYNVYKTERHTVKLTAGLSIPTGSTDERDDTPAGANQVLPYPMQIGSGTFDLLPGITYSGRTDDWSWGGQFGAIVRIGENSEDYMLGNVYTASVWGARRWVDWLSSSVRLTGEAVENIDGADPRLNPLQAPTADPKRRAGNFVDLGLGLNFLVPSGVLQVTGLSVEAIIPVFQDLDGPQLERDYAILVGLRKAF